jgi:hypothetical protein
VGEVTIRGALTPRPHQRAAHALHLVIRFLVLVWHRRAGKTVFAIEELIEGAMEATAAGRAHARFGYVAPLLKQARAVAWDYLRQFTAHIPGVLVNETNLEVTLPGGARIRLFGADNPDAMRGLYFDGVVLDEVADIRPQTWGEIIRPALADRQGWAIFIGTPKGVNLFSDLYQQALKGEDGWGCDLRRADQTDALDPAEVESARRQMSPPQFAQEFDCDFSAAVANAVCPLDAVLAAQRRVPPRAVVDASPKILGIDVAREGDDRSVIFMRQGPASWEPKVFRKLDLMELCGQAASVIAKHEPDAVFIDMTGVGAGVVDRLRQLGHGVTGVHFGAAAQPWSAMWWRMADWIKGQGCLPEMPELVRDLTAPTYHHRNSAGSWQLESKDEMKDRGIDSPDLADALALTFALPVVKRSRFHDQDAAFAHARQAADYQPAIG